jgi:hypothetical protein
MRMCRTLCSLFLFAAVLARPGACRADQIYGSGGLQGLGVFDGTFTYTATDAGHATLVVQLDNLSPAANGGYLTAFVFNNPGGITGATLTSTNTNFGLLGGPTFSGGVNGAPFGAFDLGAGLGGSFEGGGNPHPGIPVGGSATFTFAFTGNNLDGLTTQSFALSPSHQGDKTAFFVARFKGFVDGGSDKVPGVLGGGGISGDAFSPEPGSLTLAGVSLATLLGFGWARRRRAPAPPATP